MMPTERLLFGCRALGGKPLSGIHGDVQVVRLGILIIIRVHLKSMTIARKYINN